jgi:hypothetical protein
VIVEAGACGAAHAAEPENHTPFVRAYGVDSGSQPDEYDHSKDVPIPLLPEVGELDVWDLELRPLASPGRALVAKFIPIQ